MKLSIGTLAALVCVLASSTALAATKADMKLAIDSTDMQDVFEVKLSDAQPAMLGLISVDVLGTIDEVVNEQTMYIKSGDTPALRKKFVARKVQ